jgi:hypothetical protein
VKLWKKAAIALAGAALIAFVFVLRAGRDVGVEIDRYKGVVVYDNGPLVFKAHGRHYSPAGYYWGQKWQCVEFVKRFYDVAKGHHMPDVWGHAKDFFDEAVPQGQINSRRGLRQFRNGAENAPAPDDLLVIDGHYGHVAIISEVGPDYVEVIQQNIYRRPRQRFQLAATNGLYLLAPRSIKGWLRRDAPP